VPVGFAYDSSPVDDKDRTKEFLILLKESGTFVGRIWSLEDGQLLVGESFETVTHIPVAQILRSKNAPTV
jgi:hypothetical protein